MGTRMYLIILLYFSTFVSESEIHAAYCPNECVNGFYDICSDVNAELCHCYCDNACSLFNDCCQNSTESHTETTDVGKLHRNSCGYVGTKRCKIVDSCVRQWENETTKAKCEDVSNDVTFTNVNELPVFGLSSEIALLYKNQFCALCNLEKVFELVLPGIVPRSCNVFRLLEILPVVEEDIEKVLSYLAVELRCEMVLEAAYRLIHCRNCDCISISEGIWNVDSPITGFILVNYLQETSESYDCVIKDNPAETTISDGVCNIGEKYMDSSCVRVFSVSAPVQTWRFIHIMMDHNMDNESYALDTAAAFIEAAKRAVTTRLKIYKDWVLYWQVREIRGKNNMSFQTCIEIQLDIILEGDILEDPYVMFMSDDLFEICEECRQKNTFVPEHLFSETTCSIPHCQLGDLPILSWMDMWETASNTTANVSLMNTTANTPVTITSETLTNVTKDPDDLGMENGAPPCTATSTLDVVFVGLSLVAFTVLFPPLTYHH